MTTYAELITRSLRSLGVLEGSDVASGNEALTALDTLNELMHALIHDSVDLEHITGSLTETVPLPESQIGPIRYILAMHLAPEYGIQPPPALVALAENSYNQLQREYLDPDTLEMPEMLQGIFRPNNLFLNRL
jgi:hypothetical protein